MLTQKQIKKRKRVFDDNVIQHGPDKAEQMADEAIRKGEMTVKTAEQQPVKVGGVWENGGAWVVTEVNQTYVYAKSVRTGKEEQFRMWYWFENFSKKEFDL